MADVFFKLGSSGTGASVADPASMEQFLLGTWGGTFTVTTDVAVLCPGTYTTGGSLTVSTRGSAGYSNWAKWRVADPDEFPSEPGTELVLKAGSGSTNRIRLPRYLRVDIPSGSSLALEHAQTGSGSAFLFGAIDGPSRFEGGGRVVGRTGGASSDQRFMAIGNAANGYDRGEVYIETLRLETYTTGTSPAIYMDGGANFCRIGTLEIDASSGEWTSGVIQTSFNTFDTGSNMEIGYVKVEGTDDEDSYLIRAGSMVTADYFTAALMQPRAPDSSGNSTNFGKWFVGGIDGDGRAAYWGDAWGYAYTDITSPPTLTGTTVQVNPSTTGANCDAGRTGQVFKMPIVTAHESAQTREVSLELLLNSTLDAAATKAICYIVVTYLADGDSAPTIESTYDEAGGSLDASTASWSATTYNSQALTKRKLSLTTASNVAVGSIIKVELYWGAAATASSDFFLYDTACLVEPS